jgi:apurinic endonuclease APN1
MVLFIGAHLNKDGRNFINTVIDIIALGGNAISIFTSNPQSSKIVEIPATESEKVKKFIKDNNFILVSHSKYSINLSNPKPFTHHVYYKELDNIYKMGGIGAVVHTGKSTTLPHDVAVDNMRENIIKVIRKIMTTPDKRKNLKIIIETAAGCGTELFWDIKELGTFYKSLKNDKKYVRFCVDTCHIFSAGYDIRTKKGMRDFLNIWDNSIGLNKIIVIHLNDSRTPLNSHVDRHAVLGTGYITNKELGGSMEGIEEMIKFAQKRSIPLILERGSTGGATKKEIDLVRKIANR